MSQSQSQPTEVCSQVEAHPHRASEIITESFNPGASMISPDDLNRWLNAPVGGDLLQVPGIGDKNKETLMKLFETTSGKEANIENTFHLIGRFLSLRGSDTSNNQHCDKFWCWLKENQIKHGRNTIVRAVAEKCNILYKYFS